MAQTAEHAPPRHQRTTLHTLRIVACVPLALASVVLVSALGMWRSPEVSR